MIIMDNMDFMENAREKLKGILQKELADIAVNDPDEYVRAAAMEELTDQALLADLAVNGPVSFIRKAAVEKLTDTSVLASVLKYDQSCVRMAAVKKLTDPAILEYVARNDADTDIVRAALQKLDDEALIEDIVTNYTDMYFKSVADLLPSGLLKRLLDKDPEKFCRLSVPELLCKRKKDWVKKLSGESLACVLDYYQSLWKCPPEIADSLIKAYKKGRHAEEIKAHGAIVLKPCYHDDFGSICHDDHFHRTQYLSDRLL